MKAALVWRGGAARADAGLAGARRCGAAQGGKVRCRRGARRCGVALVWRGSCGGGAGQQEGAVSAVGLTQIRGRRVHHRRAEELCPGQMGESWFGEGGE
jgi:hypothetical protein